LISFFLILYTTKVAKEFLETSDILKECFELKTKKLLHPKTKQF